MMPKFRFYVLLTVCSGLVFFALYKVLRTETKENKLSTFEQSNDVTIQTNYKKLSSISTTSSIENQQSPYNLNPMKNVNELISITQPSQHLLKQKLREAELHAKIRENSLKWQSSDEPNQIDYSVKNHPDLKHRIVHLDLKGAPPLVGYYSKFFSLIRRLGATGLLIEYEDMFPFYGEIDNFKAYNAYSKENIRIILELAKANNLEVIPLVQTFGHLEFMLKQPQFMNLREVPEYPQVICPSQNESTRLLRLMIDQVVELHPKIKFLHIGADEVYYLGKCDKCQEKIQREKMDLDTLFIHHVLDVAKYTKEKYAIQPIMWDDMFRSISLENLEILGIHKYVELMVWKYTPNVDEKVTNEIWEKYASLFSNIWAASAFKGATKPTTSLPNIGYHLKNHLSWMNVISDNSGKINFRGIALTGWQRYDHFAVLCELLPASIPSLALNLIYLKEGVMDNTTINKAKHILKCNDAFNITWDVLDQDVRCNFAGAKIFMGVQRFVRVQLNLFKIANNNHVIGWLTDYQVRMKFGSPAHVEIGLKNLPELITNTTLLYTLMENALPEVYDTYTTREWLEANLNPIVDQLKSLKSKENILMNNSIWPRRPLILPENKKNIIKELAILNHQIDQ